MRTAIAAAAALRTFVAAPVAAGAGEPRAPGRIGCWKFVAGEDIADPAEKNEKNTDQNRDFRH